jgi:hypothetical protein
MNRDGGRADGGTEYGEFRLLLYTVFAVMQKWFGSCGWLFCGGILAS